MKFRKGFVTNSSSSSFICQICGYVTSGWDMTSYEAGFVTCENGHEFCSEHLVNIPKDMESYDFAYNNGIDYDDIPAEHCPICQMQVLSDKDLMSYIETKGMTRDAVLEEISGRFASYDEFKAFLAVNK